MEFTSFIYCFFLILVVAIYWALPSTKIQNLFLLAVSYIFYGFIHPWFCILIAASTGVDYLCGIGMEVFSLRKKSILLFSLIANLGFLGIFKYFNFFAENIHAIATSMGIPMNWESLEILLPVGISFYTFQTISYTIDVYKNQCKAERNFVNFGLFVAFFPQLVAGPIERAHTLLNQITKQRIWNKSIFFSAFPLFLIGYLKKLVVADNIAVWVDRVFMLQQPSFILFFVGSLGFAIQIFADFSAYMDIARGSARLLGFELSQNFNAPFLALSPSDFWRRWHITFSSWIRDYLYIPLGGSKVTSKIYFAFILFVTMGLSGLWHGAAWNYIIWGLYHATLLLAYHMLGFGGKWKPISRLGTICSWFIFQTFSIFGWSLFRAPSLSWLLNTIRSFEWGYGTDFIASSFLIALFFGYSILWIAYTFLEYWKPKSNLWHASWQWSSLVVLVLLSNRIPQQFIYFQF